MIYLMACASVADDVGGTLDGTWVEAHGASPDTVRAIVLDIDKASTWPGEVRILYERDGEMVLGLAIDPTTPAQSGAIFNVISEELANGWGVILGESRPQLASMTLEPPFLPASGERVVGTFGATWDNSVEGTFDLIID
jgi:hypothetical protein